MSSSLSISPAELSQAMYAAQQAPKFNLLTNLCIYKVFLKAKIAFFSYTHLTFRNN